MMGCAIKSARRQVCGNTAPKSQCEALGTCWHIIADKFLPAMKNARQKNNII